MAVLLFASATACRPSSRPALDGETAKYLEQFRPFPNKLTVAAVYPEKIAYSGDDEIVVRFSQPMVSLGSIGSVVTRAPLRLEPMSAGNAWWENPGTLVFRADKPFVEGERYRVVVFAGVESLTGAVLLAEREFSFIVIPRDKAGADAAGLSAFQPSFRLGETGRELPFDITAIDNDRRGHDAKGFVTLMAPPSVRVGDRFIATATVKNPGKKAVDLRMIWQSTGLKIELTGGSHLTLNPGEEIPVVATLEVLSGELKAAGLMFHRDNGFVIATDVRFLAEGKGTSLLASLPLKILSEPEKSSAVTGSVDKERSHVFARTGDMDPNYGGLTLRLTSPAANRLREKSGDDVNGETVTGRVLVNGHEMMRSRLEPLHPIDELFLPMAKLPGKMTVKVIRDDGADLFYELAFTYARTALGGAVVEKGASLTRALYDSTGARVGNGELWSGGIYEVRLSLYTENDVTELKIEDRPAGGVTPVPYATVAEAGKDFIRHAAVNLHPRVYTMENGEGVIGFVMRGIKPGLYRLSYYVRAEYPGMFYWPQALVTDRGTLAQIATTGVMKVQIR